MPRKRRRNEGTGFKDTERWQLLKPDDDGNSKSNVQNGAGRKGWRVESHTYELVQALHEGAGTARNDLPHEAAAPAGGTVYC